MNNNTPQKSLFTFPQIKSAAIIFFLAAALTYVVTVFFITPKYQSTAVIFPPNTHANIHLVSGGLRFGYDKEIGEQLEILNSNAVRNQLIEEFDLINQYGIDTTKPYYLEKLQNQYDNNIELERTINKSIKIAVRDEDPARAAQMANRLIVLADEHKSDILHQNLAPAEAAAKASFTEKEALIKTMTDSLESMRKAGESVWTFGEERKSGKYQNYELQYRKELDRYQYLKAEWENLRDLLKESVPSSYVVSVAIPSSKPVYPKKALFSLLAGCFAAILYLVFVKLRAA